jgi:hypothetical protein
MVKEPKFSTFEFPTFVDEILEYIKSCSKENSPETTILERPYFSNFLEFFS